ncbi:hypothetical protein GCM10022291_23130 [Postechiella marina]|uniref:Ig-like domain-containing protein n=2 Tax=Postechiella marina TaxID=943941 RepID=A0ABP8CBG7_9FLAO
MTTIDGDLDGTPDGIINLYDQYNAIPGVVPISPSDGAWFDPKYRFAIDDATGNLFLWDLKDASESIDTYRFQLIDPSSSCANNVRIELDVVLGPFEGNPLPPAGANDANITVCQAILKDFDLFQVFESQPSPHKNGVWQYIGNLGDDSNFKGLTPDGKFDAEIPYVPFGDLIEFDVFEFTYTVSGITPCSGSKVSRFKVEVIRDVLSGEASTFDICESDVLSGLWDVDINLRDDRFLVNEDEEGTWSTSGDATGQISNPLDSTINLKEVFDYLKANNPKYGCAEFKYKYTVEARSTLTDCPDKESEIIFRFYETIKPFEQETPLDICLDGNQPNTINLYDEITFTTENGIVYNYPENDTCVSWSFVSGPSDLRSITSPHLMDITNVTRADAGEYVFRYNVSASCNSCPDGGTSTCLSRSTLVTVNLNATLYAGEDTLGLEFCETDTAITGPLDLFTLLTANGIDNPIYKGTRGSWVDGTTGKVITNPITLPEINNQQTFDFLYSTTSPNGCFDRASLSFTVYEAYQSGVGSNIDVCTNNTSFNLFDVLTGNPNTTGTWSGPNGYATTDYNVIFDPSTFDEGQYTYTVPDNSLCVGNQASIIVTLFQSPNPGSDMLASVCKSDLQIDLTNYLDSNADSGGVFIDSDNTNLLSGNNLDVSQLSAGTYNFQYEIQGNASCNLATSQISITVEEVNPPLASNQIFCASDGATVSNLTASNGVSFNWYEDESTTTVLPFSTVLIDDKDYFVSAVDANGCESSRVAITVSLLTVNHPDCDTCLKDGVSVNNDGENDVFDLCNLPVTFPNFEINIYNRYGTLVFKGNKNTSLFKGESNVSLTLGKVLPSGVYFYVFDPKDRKTEPIQGNFYLSR